MLGHQNKEASIEEAVEMTVLYNKTAPSLFPAQCVGERISLSVSIATAQRRKEQRHVLISIMEELLEREDNDSRPDIPHRLNNTTHNLIPTILSGCVIVIVTLPQRSSSSADRNG